MQYYIWKQISFPEESTLTREYDDVPELNDNGSSEFDNFAEYDSDLYSNFDKVDEYNGVAEEFPMADDQYAAPSKSDVFGSSASKKAAEEAEKRDKEFVKRYLNISAAQVATATFVALVAVSAIIIPAIENEDVDVFMEVGFENDFLYFFIELDNTADEELYYAVVLENDSIVYQKVIEGNYISDSIGGMDLKKDHKVEVRSGHPPLLVLESKTIPGRSVSYHLYPDVGYIEYDVSARGYSEEMTVSLYDPSGDPTGAASGPVLVYEQRFTESYSDTIRDLQTNHEYRFVVSSPNETYVDEYVSTKGPTQATIDSLEGEGNTARYTVTVVGEEPLMICLLDAKVDEVLASKNLSVGSNSGTFENLAYDAQYSVEVRARDSAITEPYATGRVVTQSAMEFTELSAYGNTLTYNLLIRATGETYTLTVSDPRLTTVYTKTMTSSFGETISDLSYNTYYNFRVISEPSGYELVTGEQTSDPLTATVTPTGNTINYEVTLNGQQPEEVMINLYSDGVKIDAGRFPSGSTTVSSSFTGLSPETEYTIKVEQQLDGSSGVTYYEEAVTTKEAVTVNDISVVGNKISCNLTNNMVGVSHNVSVTDGRTAFASDTLRTGDTNKDFEFQNDSIQLKTTYYLVVEDPTAGADTPYVSRQVQTEWEVVATNVYFSETSIKYNLRVNVSDSSLVVRITDADDNLVYNGDITVGTSTEIEGTINLTNDGAPYDPTATYKFCVYKADATAMVSYMEEAVTVASS